MTRSVVSKRKLRIFLTIRLFLFRKHFSIKEVFSTTISLLYKTIKNGYDKFIVTYKKIMHAFILPAIVWSFINYP